MQPSSFNGQNSATGAQQPLAASNPDLPQVPPPAVPASAWIAATDQDDANAGDTEKASAAGNVPAIADDSDLIEKEWVSKVKQVVHTTAHDPHEQNKQFAALRAEYMQKRYGKQIKSEE